MNSAFELAQVNVARLAAADREPATAIVRRRPRSRQCGGRSGSPGFRWRLQSESGNATDVVAFQWDRTAADSGIIVNLSVWSDPESLRSFVFGGDHVTYLRRRREWFLPMTEAYAVCWWVPTGHRPSTDEAEERVRYRREHGSTAYAFDLGKPHPPPTQ